MLKYNNFITSIEDLIKSIKLKSKKTNDIVQKALLKLELEIIYKFLYMMDDAMMIDHQDYKKLIFKQ